MAPSSAKDVASWFLNRVERDSGDSITHLKLQKLVYYAQAWYLANFSKPLFEEDFEAWPHGPVCQTIWHMHKNSGWEALPPAKSRPKFEPRDERLLTLVWDKYGSDTAKQLEKQTHEEDPWKEARGNLAPEAKCNTVISKQSMMAYYKERLNAAKQSKG